MSNRRNCPVTSYNFEIRPFSVDAFTLRETGKPFIALLKGKTDEVLKDVDLLGAVFCQMPKKDRRRLYDDSVVCFIDFAMKHPEALLELRNNIGDKCQQFGLWSQTQFQTNGTIQ
jgi:hypothetical protein